MSPGAEANLVCPPPLPYLPPRFEGGGQAGGGTGRLAQRTGGGGSGRGARQGRGGGGEDGRLGWAWRREEADPESDACAPPTAPGTTRGSRTRSHYHCCCLLSRPLSPSVAAHTRMPGCRPSCRLALLHGEQIRIAAARAQRGAQDTRGSASSSAMTGARMFLRASSRGVLPSCTGTTLL